MPISLMTISFSARLVLEASHDATPSWLRSAARTFALMLQTFAAIPIGACTVTLGRLGGMKGGPARAASLSAGRRREIAKRAARTRWARERDAESSS
jgi:hypothetical protein